MFCLETKSLKLKLEILPVKSLLQHEEILPEAIDKLVFDFKNWDSLRNPVIVDENRIVLDGNHRFFAFKKLKLTYIPVCRIDYFKEGVELRYWFRVLKKCDDIYRVERIVYGMGGSIHPVGDGEILETEMETHCFSCGIQLGKMFALVSFAGDMVSDAVSAYGAVEQIQSELKNEGLELKYKPCDEVLGNGSSPSLEDGDLVIRTPKIRKEMVIKASVEGNIFPPKATRHLFPARPLHINIPTFWLKDNMSLDVINKKFKDHLNSKSIKRFGPGEIIGGRYYGEELLVFYR